MAFRAAKIVALIALLTVGATAGSHHNENKGPSSSVATAPSSNLDSLHAASSATAASGSTLTTPSANKAAAGHWQHPAATAAAGQRRVVVVELADSTATPPAVKPLWPLDAMDLAVLAIIVFSLSLAGGAGIGGGAILVPVFLMLRGWPTAIAVALSNVTILGGSFANFICNVRRHRPDGKRTIDWELILMMEPTTIAGALVGALANKVLPNWVTTYLLAILLTLMAIRLYVKGRQTYAKETQLLAAAKAATKERRLQHHHRAATSSALLSPTAAAAAAAAADDGVDADGVVAVPQSRRALRHSGSISHSINRSIGRSFSRVRGGSLVVGGFEPGSSLTSPSGFSAAGSTLVSPAAARFYSAATAAAADHDAAAGDDGGGRDAGVVRGSDQQLATGQAVENYINSTLFQGDDIDFQPVVALPPSDDLSLDSSSDNDVEEGNGAGVPELLQPLLARSSDTSAARGAASPSGDDDLRHSHDQTTARPTSGSSAAHGAKEQGWQQSGDLRAKKDSPDLTIHLGDVTTPPKAPNPERSLPLAHFFTLVGLSAWVVAADITQDSFRCGSLPYWGAQLSVLVPVIAILAVTRQVLLRKYRHDDLPVGTQPAEGELHWTKTTTILYPLLCSTAGLIAGLFGIGGGVVKGPLMLELGVPADVAAATSATMIMFTAGSACLVYSRFGTILYDYAAVLVVLGFLVTLCSQLLTFMLIKLLGRRSIIVFMMVALMGAATGIMYIQSGLVTKDLINHPEDLWKFGSICPALKHGHALKHLGQALVSWLPL